MESAPTKLAGVLMAGRGGEIWIAAARDRGGLEIAIADTGVGIPKNDLERLGKPFEQASGQQIRADEGTGLGLALVKALAAFHGGDMRLQSEQGRGTTVRVTLPHAAVSETGAAPENLRETGGRFKGAA